MLYGHIELDQIRHCQIQIRPLRVETDQQQARLSEAADQQADIAIGVPLRDVRFKNKEASN
jgi:hypothetical protein